MDCWWWNELFITTVPDVPTDQLLLASPGVCWQHILKAWMMPHCSDIYTTQSQLLALTQKPALPLCLCEWATVPAGNRNKWEHTAPRLSLHAGYFSSLQLTLFSPWINTDSHWFTLLPLCAHSWTYKFGISQKSDKRKSRLLGIWYVSNSGCCHARHLAWMMCHALNPHHLLLVSWQRQHMPSPH